MMKPGVQIAYIPLHAGGDLEHPDVEFGFVVDAMDDTAWCRFWQKGRPGWLRTVANSESCDLSDLRQYDHPQVSQNMIDGIVKCIWDGTPIV